MKSFKEYVTESTGKKLYQMSQHEVVALIHELSRAKKAMNSIPKWEQQLPMGDDDIIAHKTPKYQKAVDDFNKARAEVIAVFGIVGTRYNKYAAGPKQLDSQQLAERMSEADALKKHAAAVAEAQKKGLLK